MLEMHIAKSFKENFCCYVIIYLLAAKSSNKQIIIIIVVVAVVITYLKNCLPPATRPAFILSVLTLNIL